MGPFPDEKKKPVEKRHHFVFASTDRTPTIGLPAFRGRIRVRGRSDDATKSSNLVSCRSTQKDRPGNSRLWKLGILVNGTTAYDAQPCHFHVSRIVRRCAGLTYTVPSSKHKKQAVVALISCSGIKSVPVRATLHFLTTFPPLAVNVVPHE